MASSTLLDPGVAIDPIEEIRLRTWARTHYVQEDERSNLHPVILDEMQRRDEELEE